MSEENKQNDGGIVVNHTVDGVAVSRETVKTKADKGAVVQPRQKPDKYIWGIYIMLLVVSVIELFSASSTEVSGSNVYMPLIRHCIFLVLGLGIVLAFQNIPYSRFSLCAVPFAIISLGLLLASNFFGIEINGAQRAISIAGFTIQPAEIVKLSVIILLARILGKNQKPKGVTTSGIVQAAVVVVLFAGMLWKNGLTNTLLLFVVSLSMFLIGGMKWRQFFIILTIYGACAGLLYAFKYTNDKGSEFDSIAQTETMGDKTEIDRTGTQIQRIIRFIKGVSPEDPIDDYNRQVIFAKISQANGGLLGQGPGNSRESARLPLAFSDYIYSIVVEDIGFVGGVILIVLYLFLLSRAGRIGRKCRRAFPAFLIMGCAVLIVFQALVHMAIVTGLFPVSGQPLPFISKGGTSVLVMSAAIGIMLSVSRYAVISNDRKEIKEEMKDLPEDMRAANFSSTEK